MRIHLYMREMVFVCESLCCDLLFCVCSCLDDRTASGTFRDGDLVLNRDGLRVISEDIVSKPSRTWNKKTQFLMLIHEYNHRIDVYVGCDRITFQEFVECIRFCFRVGTL